MHIVTGRADTILVNFADISYGMDSVHAVHNKCNELWYTGFRTVMCIPDGYQRRLTPEHVLLAPQFLDSVLMYMSGLSYTITHSRILYNFQIIIRWYEYLR